MSSEFPDRAPTIADTIKNLRLRQWQLDNLSDDERKELEAYLASSEGKEFVTLMQDLVDGTITPTEAQIRMSSIELG